jgi:hypothetical protein
MESRVAQRYLEEEKEGCLRWIMTNSNSLEPIGSTMYQCYWGGGTELGRFIRRFSLFRTEIKRIFHEVRIAPSDLVIAVQNRQGMTDEVLWRCRE